MSQTHNTAMARQQRGARRAALHPGAMARGAVGAAVQDQPRDRQLRFAAAGFVALCVALLLCLAAPVWAYGTSIKSDASRFLGEYSGSAEVQQLDGSTEQRDMSVTIAETEEGFSVEWRTAIRRADGDERTKAYRIDFLASERDDVFSAAMKTNVFGHTVQMNPMKGEPYVWARIIGDTLTVFSLYVAENGDYLMQQYDRTLAEGGLELEFSLHRNGRASKSVTTFLRRED